MLVLLIAVSSSQVSHQRPEEETSERARTRRASSRAPTHFYQPVVSGDAGGTRPSGLLVLLIVVGVDVGLLGLLLQDGSEVVFADAAEERADVVRLLDHPLQTSAGHTLPLQCH